jgi:hypothetical protein
MQRRTFLASLIATAILDPERLFSIPAAREWIWINLREMRESGLFSNHPTFSNSRELGSGIWISVKHLPA